MYIGNVFPFEPGQLSFLVLGFSKSQSLAFIHINGLKTTIKEANSISLENMVSSILKRADQKGFLSQQKKLTIKIVLKNGRGWRI